MLKSTNTRKKSKWINDSCLIQHKTQTILSETAKNGIRKTKISTSFHHLKVFP